MSEKDKPDEHPTAAQPPEKAKRRKQPATQFSAGDYITKLWALFQIHEGNIGTTGRSAKAPSVHEGQTESPTAPTNSKKLAEDPEQQATLAAKLNYGPSKWLLEQEVELIADRRALHQPLNTTPFPDPKEPGEDIYGWARTNQLTGLCFSGGGIRSATFNLGILQAMAAKDWLAQFDYLSSVSGGGYIHSWLAGWLKRKVTEFKAEQDPEPVMGAWRHVTERLCPLSSGRSELPVQTVWPRQIQWLRRYSNYLTPRKGALSGDTWAAVASWMRNVLLNQALLLLIFLAVLCLPHLLAPATRLEPHAPAKVVKAGGISTVKIGQLETALSLQLTDARGQAASPPGESNYGPVFKSYFYSGALPPSLTRLWTLHPHFISLAMLALLFYVFGCTCIGSLLRLEYGGARRGVSPDAMPERRGSGFKAWLRQNEFAVVCWGIVMPLLSFGIVLTEIVRCHPPTRVWTFKVFCLLLGLVWIETFCGGALGNTVAQEEDNRQAADVNAQRPGVLWRSGWTLILLLLGVPAAVAGSLLATLIAALLRSTWMSTGQHWLMLSNSCSLQVTVGTLLFFWLPPLTMVIASGMIGKKFPDWLGEWLARIRAYTLVVGLVWICLVGCALLGPGAMMHVFSSHWAGWTGLGAWLVATLTGVLSGKSGKTSGDQQTSGGALEWVATAAPYLYIAGLVLLLSWLLELCRDLGWHWPGNTLDWSPAAVATMRWLRSLGWPWLGNELRWLTAALAMSGLAALLGWRLDINQFSMHSFYRNRLTRCYLGASNLKRNPSPVTGFDERDSNDLYIHELRAPDYPGPIPIFCCAMNITTGEDLAWQERKAASFALTPAYSGYSVSWTEWRENLSFNGFVPTKMLYPGGPTVATAMAASGAAVSPNWGYHTQSATAFLLTMFDARLGLWIPNPRRSAVAGRRKEKAAIPPSSPRFAPFWLINELLGSVDDTSKYVYVTDGGHFDNMGLYELVRRRCYRIVICDAEEDGNYDYDGIGSAIRKCRIDFGAEIKLDLADLSPNTKSLLSPAHIVRGTIRYPETPLGEEYEGIVTYIKASLTAKAPPPLPPAGGAPAASAPGTVKLPDVPGDVQSYKLQHEDFPHDSTAEQWFTESQFESYRRLGQSVIDGLPQLF
jgi:hypothetical protein